MTVRGSSVANVAVILHLKACHLLLLRANANSKGHSIQIHGVPITISNAFCAGQKIERTYASAAPIVFSQRLH